MKQFLQKKAKLVFLCMLVLLTCTACANPRGRDGKTLADQIIASEETTMSVFWSFTRLENPIWQLPRSLVLELAK